MRKLILDKIEELRTCPDGWQPHDLMRWSKYYLVPNGGLAYFYSKKDKHENGGQQAILLKDTTPEDFESLHDSALLDCYTKMIRIMSKQM